jgi:hypothetical protein
MFSVQYATFEQDLDAVALLRQQVQQCHTELDEVAAVWLQDTSLSAARSHPVRLYLHALCIEDLTIHSILREGAPLFASRWPSLGGPTDLAALRQYAATVYAATDAYLRELRSDGLSRIVDLERRGLGRRTVAWVIRRFVVVELGRTCSEISAA